MQFTKTQSGKNYTLPFILLLLLFFMWGFAHSMLDVLNKHFQTSLNISMTQSALVQNAVYGGYFLMALPAGRLIMRHGYRAGVLTGLLLFAFGALLFVPLSAITLSPLFTFYTFVAALFIVGCGLTCLETSANPYATILGDPSKAEQRINFAQSFNGLGWVLGPLVGIYLFRNGAESNDVAIPYAIIGIVALMAALIFSRVKLPEINEENEDSNTNSSFSKISLWRHPHFTLGILTLMLYVAAQTGINSFFINYATDAGISAHDAALILAFGCMSLFMIGRLLGAWLMRYIQSYTLLTICGIGAMLSMLCLLFGATTYGTYALAICYLFESIMFPTLFSLAIRNLGERKKEAGSFLIMSIVGGALAPTLMAALAEYYGQMSPAFTIPLMCFFVITLYATYYQRLLHITL